MFRRGFAFLIGLLFFCCSVKADDLTIYDIVKNEDQDAFSDMVIIGYGLNQQDENGNSALMLASSLGKVKFVRFLLLNDALTNLRNNNGETALHLAAQIGNNNIIEELLKSGATINMPDMKGLTPLMSAVLANKLETVQFLHEHNADLNYHNAKGETALRLADRKHFSEISLYLRKNKATY